jgi:DNA-binding MarR family transcriptional regulator
MRESDGQRATAQLAASPESLRQLIQDLFQTTSSVWAAAAESVHVSLSDLAALARLTAAESMTGVELRDASGLTSSSITELADRLERSGLITRSRQTHDRRLVLLTPTAKGRRTIDRALAPLDARLAMLWRGFDPTELQRGVQFLHDIGDALRAAESEIRSN